MHFDLLDVIDFLEQDLQLICVKRYYSVEETTPFTDLIFSKPTMPFTFIEDINISIPQSVNWQQEGF